MALSSILLIGIFVLFGAYRIEARIAMSSFHCHRRFFVNAVFLGVYAPWSKFAPHGGVY